MALAVIALTYPADYVHGFFVFALLPVGAGVLPCIVWPLLEAAWPLSYSESRHSPNALLIWIFGAIVFVCTAASLASICAGTSAPAVLGRLPLAVGVGFSIAVISLCIVVRFGIISALALTIMGTIVSATLGGDVLAKTYLWLIAFSAWPINANTPARYAVAAFLTLLIAAVGSWTAKRLLQTKALQPMD